MYRIHKRCIMYIDQYTIYIQIYIYIYIYSDCIQGNTYYRTCKNSLKLEAKNFGKMSKINGISGKVATSGWIFCKKT